MPTLKLIWAPGRDQDVHAAQALAPDAARQWLDEQYVALDCQPLRASGKVLAADKLLVIADAAGEARFADAAYASAYAAAAAGMTGSEHVVIDLPGRTTGY
jgi:hypothetical protein